MLHEGTQNHKLSKKDVSLNAESWLNKNIDFFM